MIKQMTMATLCGGAVQERVDRALRSVSDNILDPNTDPKKKRKISLTITFLPNEDDREDVTVTVDVSKTLAPDTGIRTQMYISKDLSTGAMTVQEHARGEIKGQLSFDDMGDYEEEQEPEMEQQEESTREVLDFRRQSL